MNTFTSCKHWCWKCRAWKDILRIRTWLLRRDASKEWKRVLAMGNHWCKGSEAGKMCNRFYKGIESQGDKDQWVWIIMKMMRWRYGRRDVEGHLTESSKEWTGPLSSVKVSMVIKLLYTCLMWRQLLIIYGCWSVDTCWVQLRKWIVYFIQH